MNSALQKLKSAKTPKELAEAVYVHLTNYGKMTSSQTQPVNFINTDLLKTDRDLSFETLGTFLDQKDLIMTKSNNNCNINEGTFALSQFFTWFCFGNNLAQATEIILNHTQKSLIYQMFYSVVAKDDDDDEANNRQGYKKCFPLDPHIADSFVNCLDCMLLSNPSSGASKKLFDDEFFEGFSPQLISPPCKPHNSATPAKNTNEKSTKKRNQSLPPFPPPSLVDLFARQSFVDAFKKSLEKTIHEDLCGSQFRNILMKIQSRIDLNLLHGKFDDDDQDGAKNREQSGSDDDEDENGVPKKPKIRAEVLLMQLRQELEQMKEKFTNEQNEHRKTKVRVQRLQIENTSLKSEIAKWRQQADQKGKK